MENIKEFKKIFENSRNIGSFKKRILNLLKQNKLILKSVKTLEKNVVKTISDTKVDIKTPF